MSTKQLNAEKKFDFKFEDLIKRFPKERKEALVLPMLHEINKKNGFVSDADVLHISQTLNIPLIQVEECTTWYTMLNKAKQGKYLVKVCRNVSCSLRGSNRMLDYLEKKLAIKEGETTQDGLITLGTAECLASCGTAPVLQVNETYHENVDYQKIDQILGGLS